MIVAIDFGITNTDIAVSKGGALDFSPLKQIFLLRRAIFWDY